MSDAKQTLVPARADEQQAASSRMIRAAIAAVFGAATIPPSRAIVLGGGACREIPLAELAARFDELVITDIRAPDRDSILRGHGLDDVAAAKITWRVEDLTGQTARLAEAWGRALATARDVASAIEAMSQVAEAESPPLAPAPIDAARDVFQLVIASCLLSQLHTPAWREAHQQFAVRFPDAASSLGESPRWLAALATLARAMERRFVDHLAGLVAISGRIYLSESVRVSFMDWAGVALWSTAGALRMTASGDLADYFDERFTIQARDRWAWIIDPPRGPGERGKAFDVQGMILKLRDASD